jgi:hypothetical protein
MTGGSRTQSHCSRAHAAKELASGPGTPEGHPTRARGTRLSDGAAPAVSGTRCASSALKSVGRVGHALV